jgi:hypothetical protein
MTIQPLLKLVLVAEFNFDIFQWKDAFVKYGKKLGVEIKWVMASPAAQRVYNNLKTDDYWKAIREADAVFVYVTRTQNRRGPHDWQWWELTKFVKKIIRPNAKMIAQYDDEFMWVFDPNHVWWDTNKCSTPDNHGGPEQFFKDTGILEIPDVHVSVLKNPPFKSYTTKPTYKLLLPQLFRYCLPKYSNEHKKKNIAMLLHSIRKASITHILENIAIPNNFPVTVFFGTIDHDVVNEWHKNNPMPVNSEIYSRMTYEPYMDLLWRNSSVAIDDNVGYTGWSRFTMECAVCWIPCVGSSESVEDIFPELYTASQDYAKQTELIKLLLTDKKFYDKIVEAAHKRVQELLDAEKLCRDMIAIFDTLGVKRTGFPPVPKPVISNSAPHPSKERSR